METRPGSLPLEPSGEEMRLLVGAAMDRIVRHVSSLGEQPASNVETGEALARRLLERVAPELGTDLEVVLDHLFDEVIPVSFNAAGPGYLGYIPGGGLFPAAVADLIANSVNRYVGVFAAAPGLVQLEANVLRWLCREIGYGEESGGFLTSGGSLANLSALVTARRERLPEDFLRGTIYASDQAHHSVLKAAVLAGFPRANVRSIPSDPRTFRIRVDLLEETILKDRAAGLTPFLVVGNAGTTNTGAVDDLVALADLCDREGLWLHVDAAYGGFFVLTERGRAAMAGLDRADSIVLDPHKGLFLPYGTGCLLVKDASTLRRAHAIHAEYLPAMQEDPDLVDFCEISPELSRDFRGLRVWLPIKLCGLSAFRSALDEKLDLARMAADALGAMPGIRVVAEPQLSLLAFRAEPEGVAESELDAFNRALLARVNARKRVYLTGTNAGGAFVIRICVLSFRTHRDRLEMALLDLGEELALLGHPR